MCGRERERERERTYWSRISCTEASGERGVIVWRLLQRRSHKGRKSVSAGRILSGGDESERIAADWSKSRR